MEEGHHRPPAEDGHERVQKFHMRILVVWRYDVRRKRTFPSGRFELSRFGLSRFGLADSVWPFRSVLFSLAVSVSRHFGQTMKSCRNLTLMQST